VPSTAVILIRNDYQWMLDPRYGRITAYVDKRKVGAIDLGGELAVEVDPDAPHEVRARLWWFRSPVVTVNPGAGESRLLHADIRRDLPVFKRMVLLAYRPSTALHLGDGLK
jgi:hypothetical protein